MRITALVLGILGGLGGLLAVMLAAGGAALSSAGSGEQTGTLGAAAAWSLLFVVLAFVGGGLAMSKPRAGALLLLVSGIGLFWFAGLLAVFSWPLLLIAALMAFLGRTRTPKAAPVVAAEPTTPAPQTPNPQTPVEQ